MRYAARVGRIEEILVEGPSKREPSQVTGRTRQNKIVHLAADEGLRAGAYAQVEITGAAAHYLHAELVEVTAAPLHRRQIPVASA